jgi:hypothetical protein
VGTFSALEFGATASGSAGPSPPAGDLALRRYRDFERELMPVLTRFVVEGTVRRFRDANLLRQPAGVREQEEMDQLVEDLTPLYGAWLSRTPALEDVTKITLAVAQRLPERHALTVAAASALQLRQAPALRAFDAIVELLGVERKTFAGEVLQAMEKRRRELWIERIHKQNKWELFDRGVEAFTWAALEETGNAANATKHPRWLHLHWHGGSSV